MSFANNIKNSLRSDYIIGAFHKKDGSIYFDDLRRPSGARIKGFRGVTIEDKCYVNGLELIEDEFYEFSYNIDIVDEAKRICRFIFLGNVRPIDKDNLLNVRLNEKMQLQGTNLDDANQNQEMINREVTGAPHTYIYELLQNSNDYPCLDSSNTEIPVEVKFIVTEHYLFFIHSGAPFNLRNIAAICTVNEGEKRNNTKAIGYKGMGFKSVFVNNDYVYLNSGGWSLRFDEKEINKPGEEERNWQYMPIATKEDELDDEILSVLRSVPLGMNVFFALRHQRDAKENIPNLETVFKDDRILVFIPYVDHVEVYLNDDLKYDRYKDRNQWLIKDDSVEVNDSYKSILEKSLKEDKKVPEKFQKIEKISISFAVQKEGNRLIPVEEAKVYNYLPTEKSLYLPFMLNADFVPDASRKDLPDHAWNLKVLEDAGQKYAQWWTSLFDEGYNLSSIFDILPDFRETDKFRSAFIKGFEEKLGKISCIPVFENGTTVLKPLNEIIYDNISFISSDNPVMSDDDFYRMIGFSNYHEYLPHPDVRLHPRLKEYLAHYSAKHNIGRMLSRDDIVTITRSQSFKEWMKVTDNACNLYKYLFSKNSMGYVLERNNVIFLTEDNQVVAPHTIYLDVDNELNELYMFEDLIPRMKKVVRDSLYADFNGISGKFNTFVAPTVALELTCNFDSNGYASRFQSLEDSRNFLNFLASAKYQTSRYPGRIPATFPIYLQDGSIINGTTNLYQEDDMGDSLVEQPWVKREWLNFISDSYIGYTTDLDQFLARNGIVTVSPSEIWNNYIANDERNEYIIESIKAKEDNIGFYHFLSQISEAVKFSDPTKSLKTKYKIWANDGTSDRLMPLSTVLFFDDDSNEREALLEQPWLPTESCWAINTDYLDQFFGDDREAMRTMLKNNGIAEDFSVKAWFNKCLIREHVWLEILKQVDTPSVSKSLLDFMFNNRELAEKFGLNKLREIPLALHNETDLISLNEIDSKEIVYQLSDNLLSLAGEDWFPEFELTATDNIYDDVFDGKERSEFFDRVGIKIFNLKDYIEDVILPNLSDFTNFESLDKPLQGSIGFHRFFANPQISLNEENWEALKKTPLFTLTPSQSEDSEGYELQPSSTGYFLPSDKIGELVSLDIIPASSLKSILPEYFEVEKDRMEIYFQDKLGNRKLEDNEIVKHIVEHKDDIIPYLSDYDRNLRFWRWAAQTSTNREEREAFRVFPMMDTDRNLRLPGSDKLFASAFFSKDKEAESVIRRFMGNEAHFVNEAYAVENDDIKWLDLFKSLKIGITAEYVMMKTVLPELEKFKTQEDDVVIALAGIYDRIKTESVRNPDDIKVKLSKLHVLCEGGYLPVTSAIISGEYTDVDTTKYYAIKLPNQVSAWYLEKTEENPNLKANIIKLFKLIGSYEWADAIWSAQELAKRKVQYFLDNQQKFNKPEIHYPIIGELAQDFDSKASWLDEVLKGKSLILFAHANEHGERAFDTLVGKVYLGSIYHPACDYQAHGVSHLFFISDKYREYTELSTIRAFLINRGVRWGFHGESELRLLEIPEFSEYFWREYLPTQLRDGNINAVNHFNRLLSVDNLEKYRCIPTGGGMKKPSEVYDPGDNSLVKMVKALNLQDECLANVPISAEYRNGFANKLSATHCLDYLSLNEKTVLVDRERVYEWLVEYGKNSNLMHSNFKNLLTRFKENVKWRNGKKEWRPLSELYVLDKSAESKMVMDHFVGSEFVCSWMPEGTILQNAFCSLLGIKVLSSDDFDYKPIGKTVEDPEEEEEIKKRLLYLSYIENPQGNWEEKFIERKNILEKARIECCDDIIYFYDNDERLKVKLYFLDNKAEGFCYKKGYKDKKSDSIIDWVRNTFGITSFDISFLERLFFEPFTDFIIENNNGELPTNVVKYLSPADREMIAPEQEELPVEEGNEPPYISNAPVPGTTSPRLTEPTELEGVVVAPDKIDQKQSGDQIEATPGNYSPIHKAEGTQNVTTKEQDREHLPQSGAEDIDKSEDKPKIEETFEEKSHRRWNERRDAKVTPPTSIQPTHKLDEEILDIEDKVDTKPNYGEVYDPHSKPNIKRDSFQKAQPISEKKRNYDKQVADAQRKAEEEEEKRDRRAKLHDVLPYTLQWFNYLIDMQLEAVQESASSKRTIDFYDWALVDVKNSIYRLVAPSSFIPSNLAEASNAQIKLVSNGKTTLLVSAEIIESDETGIDLKFSQHLGNSSPTRWIRIEYESTGGFSQALANRFSRLAYKYSLTTNLKDNIPDNIRFIYGPPGTGKTTELVRHISETLRSHDAFNILVVTPTNRAADEIAERLAVDDNAKYYLSRYGVTESRSLIDNHRNVLKNRQTMSMSKSSKNVMVTTIARYPYDSIDNEAIFDFNWDLIIVDEASMIDIVPITLLLINNKAPQFLIAGDPMQIRPVKPSFDFPDEFVFNIYDMVAMNSFKDAKEGKTQYPVDVLDVQHRSVPEIGNLVSSFAYEGVLKNDPNKERPKELIIPGLNVKPLNVVGYEVVPMSHLYDFNTVDKSHVHVYSPIFAYEFAAYIAQLVSGNSKNEHYSVGIVSPYKKQASAIQELLSNRPIDNDNCKISCGTVHKFQGSQCDIMIVVMNYPNTYSGEKSNINNLNIMNVAMSRAKDYVFFLCPEKNVGEKSNYPMNDELLSHMEGKIDLIHAHDIEKIMFGDDVYIAKNSSLRSHLPVNVSTPSGKRYEVRISDTALDILINENL